MPCPAPAEAVHLFIGEVPNDVLGLLQACVINYRDCLREWFGVTLDERVAVGMMTIVFDTDPERLDLSNPVMRRGLGKDAADYLTSLTQELMACGRKITFGSAGSCQIT
jgi:hypothetical protein